MSDHLIRLRAAWDGIFEGRPDARVDLPRVWTDVPAKPFVLRRRFQAPRLNQSEDDLFLRLEGAQGIVSLKVNGEEQRLPAPDQPVCEVPIENVAPTGNVIELGIDPGRWPAAVAAGEQLWGSICLVIRPRAGRHTDGGPGPKGL